MRMASRNDSNNRAGTSKAGLTRERGSRFVFSAVREQSSNIQASRVAQHSKPSGDPRMEPAADEHWCLEVVFGTSSTAAATPPVGGRMLRKPLKARAVILSLIHISEP